MATGATPKTPEKSIDVAMDDLTLAPRKKRGTHGPCLTQFLHEPEDFVKYTFHLSEGRACTYAYDKINREVRLVNVDNDEIFTTNATDDPDLIFTERDWILFYTKVWRDLNEGMDTPLFIGEWAGLTMGTRYRILADQINKHSDDYIYILCSDFGKIAEYSWPICEKDHLELYDLKFMFQWKDLAVLENIFSKINQLFQWTNASSSQLHGSTDGFTTNGLMTMANGLPQKSIDWINNFCTELGYHNLAFLTNYGVATPAADAETPDTTVDETDGCLGDTGHRIIKAILAVILEILVDKRMKKNCDGCMVDHPSQTRHSCLFEPSAYYFYGCFEEISVKLLTPELKNILAQALSQYGGRPHLQRIEGAVEAILYGLKDEMYIVEQLSLIREKLIDESCEEIIYTAVDKWKLAVSEDPEITQV
ncbi:hypothetical protein PO909_013073 [Leuciscus waleckii]